MKKINTLAIHGRRWFQTTFGNTYHSVEVIVNGYTPEKEVLTCDFRYGYGESYKQTAHDLLKNAGYDCGKEYFDFNDMLWENRETMYHDVTDVKRKRDL